MRGASSAAYESAPVRVAASVSSPGMKLWVVAALARPSWSEAKSEMRLGSARLASTLCRKAARSVVNPCNRRRPWS